MIFSDNYIDTEALKVLDEATIQILIPELGWRVKFNSLHRKLIFDSPELEIIHDQQNPVLINEDTEFVLIEQNQINDSGICCLNIYFFLPHASKVPVFVLVLSRESQFFHCNVILLFTTRREK